MKKSNTIDFTTLMNNIAAGVIVFNYDNNFTINYVNDVFLAITGYEREEFLSVDQYTDLIADKTEFADSVNMQLKTGNKYSVEYRLQKKDGSMIWVLDKGVVKDNVVQSLIVDITKQKNREQSLAEKVSYLKNLNNHIPAAIIYGSYNETYTITYGNDGFFNMIGYSKQQFKDECNNSLGLLVHPEDKAKMAENLEQQLSLGNTTVNTNRLIRRDGSFVWILALSTVSKDYDGNLVFHGVCSDITQQKEAEDALKIIEKKYEIAIGLSDVTTFDYDLRTKHIITKSVDNKIFGMPQLFTKGVEELISSGIIAERSTDAIRNLYKAIDAGEPSAQATVIAYDVNGQERIVDLHMINIFDQQGKAVRAVGVRKDITETLMLQREKEYGNIMTHNLLLTYEVNITHDKILYLNEKWAEKIKKLNITTFERLIDCICNHIVAKQNHRSFKEKFSKKYIQQAFLAGEKTISLEYKRKMGKKQYRWFRKYINIIQDAVTGDIIIRCYIVDIHDKKERDRKALEEKKIYNTMLYKADVVYGVNVTKNLAVSGHEKWLEIFGIAPSSDYTEMVEIFCKKAVHPEDKEKFLNTFLRKNLLLQYDAGQTEFIEEYRRLEKGSFVWVRCSMYLFEDPESGDVKAHCYMENVHEEKIKELNLIYRSEHDLLTDCYDKAALERYITEYLTSSEGVSGKHAFIIVDIDHFKEINDNFGHAFGDIILSRVSRKIKNLFRDQDIMGRIGGDEFVVLMKSIHDHKIVELKAQDICDELRDVFNNNGKSYNISASVGIAFYSEHGNTYDELYRRSDTALYACKKAGRNQFAIYSEKMSLINSDPKSIETNHMTTTHNNVIEHLFKLLYETDDKEFAIKCALEFVGRQYDLSRVYIFEEDDQSKYISNTYTWCAEYIAPLSKKWKNLSCSTMENYNIHFDGEGIFDLSNSTNLSSPLIAGLISADTKNSWHFAMINNNVIKGFVGFDDCTIVRTCTRKDVYDLQNIANIISSFVLAMREAKTHNMGVK